MVIVGHAVNQGTNPESAGITQKGEKEERRERAKTMVKVAKPWARATATMEKMAHPRAQEKQEERKDGAQTGLAASVTIAGRPDIAPNGAQKEKGAG